MPNQSSVSFWNEKWLPIVYADVLNPPRYEVSDYGRLRSYQTGPEPVIIKGSVIQGYRSLNIRCGGKTISRYVHKLVAECFLPPAKPGHTFVIHLDHDKLNNRAQNLLLVTKEAMITHNRANPNVLNRVMPKRTSNYKLTESKVIVIKKLLRNDKNRLKTIARQFGITHTQLNRIRSGENWKQVILDDETLHPRPVLA